MGMYFRYRRTPLLYTLSRLKKWGSAGFTFLARLGCIIINVLNPAEIWFKVTFQPNATFNLLFLLKIYDNCGTPVANNAIFYPVYWLDIAHVLNPGLGVGAPVPKVGVPNCYSANFFPKTAWKWVKFDRNAPRICHWFYERKEWPLEYFTRVFYKLVPLFIVPKMIAFGNLFAGPVEFTS